MSISSTIVNKINYTKILKDILIDNNINYEEKLKEEIQKLTNSSKKIILLGRARTAIYLSIKQSIEEKKSKIVLMSPFTIPEVVELVIYAGGTPYFIDFYKDSTFLDLDQLKESLKLQPAAIIITHYNLNQINYKEIYDIFSSKNINIIEDSAIAFTGKVNSININTFSDFSLYSFSSFKFINFFYGGALALKSEKAKNIEDLVRNWKIMNLKHYKDQIIRTIFYSLITNKHFFKLITMNYLKVKSYKGENNDSIDKKLKNNKNIIDDSYFTKLPNYAISELYRKIFDYQNRKENRIVIANEYFNKLNEITVGSNFEIKELINNSDNFNFIIKCENLKHRDNLKKILLRKNLYTGTIFYPNCHTLSKYSSLEGKSQNIRKLNEKILILPTNNRVNKKYIEKLTNEIKKNY